MNRKSTLEERRRLPRLRRKSVRKSDPTSQSRGSHYVWLFFLSNLAGVTVFVRLPFLDTMRRSFYDVIGKCFAEMKSYSTVWSNQALRLAISNTLRFLVVCLPSLLLTSFVLALFVYRGDTKHGVLKTNFVLPMVILAANMVLVWKMIFYPGGVLNQFPPGMSSQIWELNWVRGETSFGVLAVTYLWKNAGYDTLLWLAGMSIVPESLYKVARVDGAGGFDSLHYIVVPILRGAFGLMLILSIVNSLRVHREAYLLAGSYPSDIIYLIPHLFNNWFLKLDMQKMSTTAVMMTAVLMILALTINWGGNRVGRGIGRRKRRRVGRRVG